MNNLNKKILLIGLGCLTAAAGYASAPGDPQTAPRRRTLRRTYTRWTGEEDKLLSTLVAQHGTDDWGLIAFFMPDRNARSCRDRWCDYLDPEVNHSEWTLEEDNLLLETYLELGPRWARIAAFFPAERMQASETDGRFYKGATKNNNRTSNSNHRCGCQKNNRRSNRHNNGHGNSYHH